MVTALTVVRPAGRGPLVLSADVRRNPTAAIVEMYGPNQRSGGALRQLWRKFRLRGSETAPLQASMRRAVEHRALMAIAIGDLGVANTSTIAVAALDRGWTLYAHTPARGHPLDEARATRWRACGNHCACCTTTRSPTATCAASEITVDDGTVLFGGFDNAEYGATDAQLQSDIAQLLVTTTDVYDAPTGGARGDRRRSARTPC